MKRPNPYNYAGESGDKQYEIDLIKYYQFCAKENEQLNEALGLDNPYPLKDVLHKLKFATKYLLEEKSYDGHDYEELEQCVKRAGEIIDHIKNK